MTPLKELGCWPAEADGETIRQSGENLLEQALVQVTDEQLASLKLKTGHQRMDSVMVSSNIRQASRLHLLVEVIQRVCR